jgi:DNA-binding IclR family transcriptional regulator
MESNTASIPKLAFKILDYLRRHPNAKDSVEGIADWWVGEDPSEVRRALETLVELRLVARRRSAAFDVYCARGEEWEE